jgi:heat shock protein HslJ
MRSFALKSMVTLMTIASASAAAAAPLAGSEWGFRDETGERTRFIQFSQDGKATGFGGCNRFMGGYSEGGSGALTIGPIAATRMACPQPATEKEREFFALLDKVRSATVTHLELTLKDKKGETIIVLVRRDAE